MNKIVALLALAILSTGCAAQKVSQNQVQPAMSKSYSCTGTHLHRRCRNQLEYLGDSSIEVSTVQPSTGAKR